MKSEGSNKLSVAIKTTLLSVVIPVSLNLATDYISNYISKKINIEDRIIEIIMLIITLAFLVSGIIYFVTKIIKLLKFKVSSINKTLNFVKYENDPLFSLSNDEMNQYHWSLNKWKKIIYYSERVFNRFPVVYYNMSAKNFLNWIDYLYLLALKKLCDEVNAKVIVSLHIGADLLDEGIFNSDVSDKYVSLKEESKSIIKKILPEALIVDEYEYYARTKGKPSDNSEYFFGTIISQINSYVRKLANKEISLQQFNRLESNLISVLPIAVLSKKYYHLFVLDYEKSFSVWDTNLYNNTKRTHNIYFIYCKKIKDEFGKKIPCWSKTDGINFTDDDNTIMKKIESNSEAMNCLIYQLITEGKNTSKNSINQELLAAVKEIKTKYNFE